MRHVSLVCALLLGFVTSAAVQSQEGNGEWLQDRGPRFLAMNGRTKATVSVDVARTQILQRRISVDLDGMTLRDALAEISKKAHLPIMYGDDVAPLDRRVRLWAAEITVAGALTEVLMGTGVDVLISADRRAALIKRDEPAPPALPAAAGSIVGRVTGAASGVGMSGASVMLEGTELGAITGNTGRYRIADVPAATYSVRVQQVGYADAEQSVTVGDGEEATVDFAMEVSALPLDEIVATGTAFATRVRTVPNPISIITAREIEQKQATNITDMLRGEIPGVMALKNGQNDYYGRIYVRGNSTWGTSDEIKVYLDGVEVARPTQMLTMDPGSIERIEVVRGAQASTIYGSGAASGVLQIFTKKGYPGLDRPRISLQSSLGLIESDFKPPWVNRPLTQNHQLSVNGGSDAFSYHAGGSYDKVGEWITGYGSRTLGFSGGLRAVQGPLSVDLSALWSQRDQEHASTPIYQALPLGACVPCGRKDFNAQPWHGDFLDNTMGLTLGYRATPRWQHTLILGDAQSGNTTNWEAANLTPADTFANLLVSEYRRRSIRYHTTYEAELGKPVTARFTAGAEYSSIQSKNSYATGLLNAVGTVVQSPQTTTTFINQGWWNAGYFGMAELGFKDQLFLTLATRVEENPNLGDDYGRAVSPKVGASYVTGIGPIEMKLRAQWGKGVRPPPQSAQAGAVYDYAIYLPNPKIGPEVRKGWDAGAELYWGETGFVALTRFDEEGDNLIQVVNIDLDSDPRIGQYQNVGRVRVRGWEVEAGVNLGRVALKANYAYSDNIIRELSNAYVATPNQVYQVGDRMIDVPKHSGGGTATVQFWRGSASLNASIMDEWRSLDQLSRLRSFYAGDPDRGSLRAYYIMFSDALWKWNLRAEQALSDRVTALVRVDNLIDEKGADSYNWYASQGRTTVLGLRFTY